MENLTICLNDLPSNNQLTPIDGDEFRRLLRIFFKNYTSKNTKKNYFRVLNEWNEYIKEFLPSFGILGVTEEEIIDYREFLLNDAGVRGRGYTREEVNVRVAVLSAFYNYFFIKEVIKSNPAKNVKRLKTSKKLKTHAIPPEKVWEYFDLGYNPKKGHHINERVIIRLYFFMGNRLEEIRRLNIGDIKRRGEDWVLDFIIKGGDTQEKPIPEILRDEIGMLLLYYQEKGWPIDKNTPLLRASRGLGYGKRISERGIGKIIDKMTKKLKLKSNKYSSHSGRAFSLYWVEKHKGLYAAQKWANHSSPETTSKYRELTDDSIESEISDLFNLSNE